MAQASLAPCRQADIFHNQKRRRAPLSISTSSPMPTSRDADSLKAWAIPCITCRICPCSCESSCRRSPADPGISSSGRPVSIPTDIILLARFFTELYKGSFEHLLKMLRQSLLFSFTESASWARTSFNSTSSRVFVTWRLCFSCITFVSTRSPAFSCRLAYCSSPTRSSDYLQDCLQNLLLDLHARRIPTGTCHCFLFDQDKYYEIRPSWTPPFRQLRPVAGLCTPPSLETTGYSSP